MTIKLVGCVRSSTFLITPSFEREGGFWRGIFCRIKMLMRYQDNILEKYNMYVYIYFIKYFTIVFYSVPP